MESIESEKLTDKELLSLIIQLKTDYYNGNPSVSDKKYDEIEDHARERGILIPIGYEDVKEINQKIKLPFPMPSLDKKKTQKDLELWTNDKKFVIMDKLDGVSGLYYNEKIYSRYTGKVGIDRSHLFKNLNLPLVNYPVRGELVISREAFKKWKDKGYKNSRNTVAGIINSKTLKHPNIIRDIEFIAYEIIGDMSIEEQLWGLIDDGFNTVNSELIELELDEGELRDYLLKRHIESDYDIDGIVISKLGSFGISEENPDHKKSFKTIMDDQVTEATVRFVEYNISQYGILKPRLFIEPVNIQGVRIEKATLHNGKFVLDNGIGPGAKILLIRSGGVIPKVHLVLQAVKPQFPSEEWKWNKSGVEMIATDPGNNLVEKKVINFFVKMDIPNFKEKTIQRIFSYVEEESFIDYINRIFSMTSKEFEDIEGIGLKKSRSIVEGIQERWEEMDLIEIMISSSMFKGVGKKRFKLISDKINLLDNFNREDLMRIKTVGSKLADVIIDNISNFKKFLYLLPSREFKWEKMEEEQNKGQLIVCFSGFRSSDIETFIREELGGDVKSTVTKKCKLLIVKNMKETTKLKTAMEKGIEIITLSDFKERYNF